MAYTYTSKKHKKKPITGRKFKNGGIPYQTDVIKAGLAYTPMQLANGLDGGKTLQSKPDASTNTGSSSSNAMGTAMGAASLASAATSDILGVINEATKGADTSAIEAEMNNSKLGSANSLDDIQSNYASLVTGKTYTAEDLGAKDFVGGLMDFLGQSAEGAAAGAGLGPWGMLGGAIGGGVSSIASTLFGNRKRKKQAAELTEKQRQMDAFNLRSLAGRADNIMHDTMNNLEINYAALGGPLMTHGAEFDTGLTYIGNGGTHEENPYEGVPMGMDEQGIPNLVEEGEVIFDDYVFSKRLKVPKRFREKYKLGGNLTFADAALKMGKEREERPNDPISKAGFEDSMMKLQMAQEELRARNDKNTFAYGGRKYYDGSTLNLDREVDMNDFSWMNEVQGVSDITGTTDTKKTKKTKMKVAPTWLRYAPALMSGALTLTDALGITNKPDYGDADAVLEAAKSAGEFSPISFNPVGNYLKYTPFDRNYYANQLAAQQGATRRAILQNSGMNRGAATAALLAADYNAGLQMGNLYRQAEEYNLAQREKVENFNRATNMFNSEGLFKAAAANQEARMKKGDTYLKGVLASTELKQKERQSTDASKSTHLSNFIDSLGNMGKENYARNMLLSDPSKYYWIDSNGIVHYKGNKAKRGGYLTIR